MKNKYKKIHILLVVLQRDYSRHTYKASWEENYSPLPLLYFVLIATIKTMKTTLESIDNRVNRLTVQDIKRNNMKDVAAWMFTCNLQEKERENGCFRLLSDGEYSFSNIECRVSVYFYL